MKKVIVQREVSGMDHEVALCDHPVLNRIYRARGIQTSQELERDLAGLLSFDTLTGLDMACHRLSQALEKDERIIIVGDFDADGATSTAIAVRSLKLMGANHVSYLVPNRFKYGYGLTPEIVELAFEQRPHLIITVDNGIASLAGVEKANELGVDVIVTDHHLAGDSLPKACAIVNPNQPNDPFPSKNLAGCGVIFYVMLALRAALRTQHYFETKKIPEPNLAELLDIVALGTVADVVALDKNNRILVHQGVRRIRAGKCIPGIQALLELGKRDLKKIVASDLGFAVAPRLNAAGRLDDMSLGIECLLTDDSYQATKLAAQLDNLNQERRVIEQEMKDQAFADLAKLNKHKENKEDKEKDKPFALCLFDQDWHQGVIGILASRLKDYWHRPVVIFAPGENGEIKGSARSINGLHIRDIFQRVDVKHPGLIQRFGGHAMAAGLTLSRQHFEIFREAFLSEVAQELKDADLENKVVCDGELKSDDFTLGFAEILREAGPWGQHFPEPTFSNRFRLIEQRLVGERHLKLVLSMNDQFYDAIYFNVDLEQWPNHRCQDVKAAYRLDINEFRGQRNLQLMIDYLEVI